MCYLNKHQRLQRKIQVGNSYTHKCTECSAVYHSSKRLATHVKNVHKDLTHQSDIHTCPICGRMMWKRRIFQNHLLNHVDAEAVEEELRLWDRKWPEITHDIVKFSCKYCLRNFASQESFKTHVNETHEDHRSRPSWQCNCCEENLTKMGELIKHLQTSHREVFYGNKGNLMDGRRGKCDKCGKLYDIYHLKAHQLKGTCELKKATTTSTAPSYTCPMKECGLELKTVMNLKQHFFLHMKNNPFTCQVSGCGVKFSSQYHLDRHMRLHTGEMSVVCPKCRLRYSREKLALHNCGKSGEKVRHNKDGSTRSHYSSLQLQQISKSEEGKPGTKKCVNSNLLLASDPIFIQVCEENPGFKELILGVGVVKAKGVSWRCPKCNTSFTILKSLKKHRPTCEGGNGSKPHAVKYGCRLCGDYFDGADDLASHVDQKHSNQKKFKCGDCIEIFPTRKGRLAHAKRTHYRFPCQQCSRKFKDEEWLAKHAKCCTRNKCVECGKYFSSGTSFRKHMRLLHGVTVPVVSVKRHAKRKSAEEEPETSFLGATLVKVEPELITSEDSSNLLDDNEVEIKTEVSEDT